MQRAVFFDFDRTLIDTDELKQAQYARIAKMNQLDTTLVERGMVGYIASLENHLDFEVRGFAEYLAATLGIDPSTVIKVYINDTSYIRDYVFSDVWLTLQHLSARGIEMGIFSQANPLHQKLKIEASGVLEYINPQCVHIYKRKVQKEYIDKLPEGAYIVDDDYEVITQIANLGQHLVPVWCNRKTTERHPHIYTIHSLEEMALLVVQSQQ